MNGSFIRVLICSFQTPAFSENLPFKTPQFAELAWITTAHGSNQYKTTQTYTHSYSNTPHTFVHTGKKC